MISGVQFRPVSVLDFNTLLYTTFGVTGIFVAQEYNHGNVDKYTENLSINLKSH